MRNVILYLISMSCCFGGVYNFAPKIEHPEKEKRFVIIIPSYNNENYYTGNLDSVYSQNYSNFRVIYTNDASKDKTGILVNEYIKKKERLIDFTYIENNENMGPLYNICNMVSLCENDEIVVTLDGDDMLANPFVLKRLNQAYADDHVWVTYGSYECRIPEWNGQCKPMKTGVLKIGRHRKYGFIWSHLRTCYAGLYKLIPLGRWLEDGQYYRVAGDVAIMLNLIDMARDHVYFIPDILHRYNCDNPINEFRISEKQQWQTRDRIWALPPLNRINSKNDFL